MRLLILPTIVILAAACTPAAHPSLDTVPATDGVRGERARRMDTYLERAQHFGFSGAVLVSDRHGIILRRGYGPAGGNRRITPDMVFDMGSITKQFTAAAILLLEEEGRLSTRDSLSTYFPAAPADKRGITLHQLLTHTSGIISDFAGDYEQVSRDSAVRAILQSPLLAPPGAAFNYSNAGFSMLAMIVEDVTGQGYDRFMADRVYGPSGMRQTGYVIRGLDSSLVAHTFTPPVDHGTPAERLQRAGGPGWNLKGNGGALTTVDDLHRYELALRAGRPISQAIQSRQFAVQFRRGPNLAHGYDWSIEAPGTDSVQQARAGDGPATGVSAEYRRHPMDSTVFILLANNRHHGWSTRQYVMPNLRRLYRGDSVDLPLVRGATVAALDEITGTYVVDSTSHFQVERVGNHLALAAVGQRAANVMIFNRDSNSIRNRARINERARALITALATDDTSALRATFGASRSIAAPRRWWQDTIGRLGPLACTQVLGTDRLDRGVFLSTVRLRFRDGTKTVRWAWSGTTPVVSSEDALLPGAFAFGAESPVRAAARSPYWWLAGDSLVTYDLAFAQTLRARLRRESGRLTEIVFQVPGGDVVARKDSMPPDC